MKNRKKKIIRINIVKFIRSLIIILGFTIFITFIATKSIYSYILPEEKTIYVQPGDSLWTVAKFAKENSSYYKDMSIKDVIYNIKDTNNLSNYNLKSGQKLKIYYIE